MGERLLFLIIASTLTSYQILKMVVLIVILQVYIFLFKRHLPFKNDLFNSLEILSN